jgi:hypothetical protein
MALHPALAGAKAKAERGLAYLIMANPTSDHVRAAMEAFKSAMVLTKAAAVLIKEMEVPPPGAPLFGAGGVPDPEADLTVLAAPRSPMTEEEIQAYESLNYEDRCKAQEDLLFETRTFLRASGRAEEWGRIKGIWDDVVYCTDGFVWFSNEFRRGGEFLWPYQCKDCGGNVLDPKDKKTTTILIDGEPVCQSCKWKRKSKQLKAKTKAEKADRTAKKPRTSPPKDSPIAEEPGPDGREGGEE